MTVLQISGINGAEAPAGMVLLLTYVTGGGVEQVVRLLPPGAGGLAIQTSAANGAALVRIRAITPPATLAFDQAFAPHHRWPEALAITVRDPVRLPALRVRGPGDPALRVLRNRQSLVLEPIGGAVRPAIAGLRLTGAPGTPALPIEVHYVLAPPSETITDIVAVPDPAPRRTPAPAPSLQPPRVLDSPNPAHPAARRGPPRFEARPTLSGDYPSTLVRLARVERHAWGSVAVIELYPVQYDATAREYVYQPNLGYRLVTAPSPTTPDSPLFPGLRSRDQVQTLISALRESAVTVSPTVLRPHQWFVDPLSLISTEPAGLLIITDDTTWQNTTSPPGLAFPFMTPTNFSAGTPVPGMIEAFEVLAEWKTSRGMRTKVVPVTTIVASYNAGDLAPYLPGPAVDLTEMIRAFILYAAETWQTRFVMLGGTVDIVPMRQVVMDRGADFARSSGGVTVLPSAGGRSWAKLTTTGGPTDLRESANTVTTDFVLTGLNTGVLFPFSADGSGERGWFPTSQIAFENETSGFGYQDLPKEPTAPLYVIVFGGSEVDDDFAWVYSGQASQTDHYFSDINRAPDNAHDFDADGNAVPGQVIPSGDADIPLDGMQVAGDISVGRVPAASAADVAAFVAKVIAYETMGPTNGAAFDAGYLQKITLIADDWQHPWNFEQISLLQWWAYWNPGVPMPPSSQPPASYWALNGADVFATLEDGDGLATAMSAGEVTQTPPFSLQALDNASGAATDIPYDASGATPTCWYFCDENFNRLPDVAGQLASIRVRITNAPTAFDTLFWQSSTVDSATEQKERVFTQFRSLFPGFGDTLRIYRDAPDLPGQGIEELLQEQVNVAIDSGAHFLSCTGHGNVQNCGLIAMPGVGDVPADFAPANAGQPYIMFAHSCLTADPETQPCLGAYMVTQPNGALAYVGFARSCWTADAVADYELGFWCGLALFGRVGPPVARHLNSSNWQEFNQLFQIILYGDPEMPVWRAPPVTPTATFTYQGATGAQSSGVEWVDVQVTANGQPIAGLNVTVLQGWKGSLEEPVWFYATTTDDNGYANATIRAPRQDQVSIVVSTPPGWSGGQYAPVSKSYAAGQTS